MTHEPHPEIVRDIGALLSDLRRLGLVPYDSRYSPESFGDYFVEFRAGAESIRVVRDRGQYYVAGVDRASLERAGLWRAFDDRDEFAIRVTDWLRSPRASA